MNTTIKNIREEICKIDCKMRCLEACFAVISQPEMLDSVNLQILSLNTRRRALFLQLKHLSENAELLEK